MYLKSIEINGFKSFAKKIVFEFPQGITGIVGPNGSGKSNIGDAVRWVLGEQSAKQLRGSKMEDVIFSGTESRKPMGFAYVAITFENENRIIPLDYPEVTVARRVYRSGESEYLLNGSTCRRRDIVELFYDTGIGKEGYSIIGQGQVEKILSGKIEDSRELFDEAAGIAKYKKNRTVTQRSLDQERQNLERVTDILRELEKQVGPLEEQSKVAKEYLKLKEQEKDLDLHLFLYEYSSINKEIEEVNRQLGILDGHLEEARDSYDEIKQKNQTLLTQAEELSQDIAKAEESRDSLKAGKDDRENVSLILEEKIRGNEQLKEYYEEQILGDQEVSREKEEDIQDLKEKIAGQRELLTLRKKELEEIKGELEKVRTKETELEAQISLHNQEMLTILSSRTDMAEKIGRLDSLEEQLQIRNSEYNRRLLSVRSSLQEHNDKAARLQEQLEETQQELERAQASYLGLQEEDGNLAEEISRLRQDHQTADHEYLRARSRYETLSGIVERYDGYNKSIQSIMALKSKNPGIIGVVADIISVDKQYETAIEIALGGAMQNIVTEDNQVAQKMIGYLKQNHYGRATFLPLSNMRRRNIAFSSAILEDEGVIGVAAGLVRTEDRFRNLVAQLLGRTIVVDTYDNALNLTKKNNFSLRVVTLDGELFNPGGSITGGAFRNSHNLLGRKREMEETGRQIEQMKKLRSEKQEQIAEAEKKQLSLRQQLQEAKQELDLIDFRLKDIHNQIPLLANQKREVEESIDTLKKEHRLLGEQLEEIQKQKKDLARKEEDSTRSHEESNSTIDELNQRLEAVQEEIAGWEKKRTVKILEISGTEQGLGYRQTDLSRITEEKERADQNIEENQENLARIHEENAQAKKEAEEAKQEASELAGKLEDVIQSLLNLKEKHSNISRQQSLIFNELEDQNQTLLGLEKEHTRLEARAEKQESALSAQIDYMWESYEITYNHALTLKKYEIPSSQIASRRKEKKELGRQIKALGNVNVNAIDEYREVGERYEFMRGQYDDIKEAEAKLMGMIDDLNKAMKEQFRNQFSQIRDMFTSVFRDLFEGGTADLELMDEDNILECGIRIIAQPPGKKLQNILLLSGGERALTAIALLFAIQQLKPSPFCLLDEIEAALDDANIIRFSKYLKKLSEDTQFIVITHRRGTMNAAQALYGITMQEKGISTLISVDLIDQAIN